MRGKINTSQIAEAHSLFQQGVDACVRSSVDEAICCFEFALDLDRTHVASWHMLALCQARKGNQEAASNALAELNRLNPR